MCRLHSARTLLPGDVQESRRRWVDPTWETQSMSDQPNTRTKCGDQKWQACGVGVALLRREALRDFRKEEESRSTIPESIRCAGPPHTERMRAHSDLRRSLWRRVVLDGGSDAFAVATSVRI